jgi:hypothetical protein
MIKFTYIGKETRFVTKLFKNTHLRVAYTTNNSIAKLLNTHKVDTRTKFEKNAVYQLKCPTCKKKYVGQTGEIISHKI